MFISASSLVYSFTYQDLKDLFEKGIFTESEIKAIVDRRRQSEYLLRRKNARKVDFLRYAEAEMALERLRSIRQAKAMEGRLVGVQREKFEKFVSRQKKLLLQEQREVEIHDKNWKSNGDSGASKIKIGRSSGDTSIIRNIHLIFVRMKRKWKSDVSLHLAHADFAKRSKSYQQLGTIYAEALQILPKTTALWIEAASHEYFGYIQEEEDYVEKGSNYSGGSVHAARVLLQRGLRINPNAEDLWTQYFALEWHFIQKMRGRKEILKLDAFKADQPTRMLADDPLPSDDTKFFEGSIPTVVYNNAIKAIPDSVRFRLKFLEVCKLFPETSTVEKKILESIDRDFGENPDAWIVKATFALSRPNLLGEAADGNSDTKVDGGCVGFLITQESEEDESEVNNDDTSLEDSSKKKRKLITNHETDESAKLPCAEQSLTRKERVNANPVRVSCSILEEAVSRIITSDMFCKCFEFLQDLLNSKDFGTKRHRSTLVSCFQSLVDKADSNDLQSSEIVYWRARILSELGRKDDAIKLLLNKIADSEIYSKESKLWLLLVDLTIHRNSLAWDASEASHEQQYKDSSDAALILRRAIQTIPAYDSNYVHLQIALFESLLVIRAPNNVSADKELMDLFQGILLSCSQNKLPSCSAGGTDFPDLVGGLCMKYMHVSLMSGGLSSARTTYSMIIFQCLPNLRFAYRSEKLIHFFLSCLQLEKNAILGSNAGLKKKARSSTEKLLRMYDAIVQFLKQFTADEKAQSYLSQFQQLRREDLGHFGSKNL